MEESAEGRRRAADPCHDPANPSVAGPADRPDAIASLYRQSISRPGEGGRRLLRGRMTLDSLLRDDSDQERIGVHRLNSLSEVREVFQALGSAVRTEIITMVPNSSAALAGMRSSRDLDLDLLGHGVAGYLLYEPGWAADPEVNAEVRLRLDAGARARIVDRVPHRLTIFDRRVAILPVEPSLTSPGALVVREQGMVASLRALFTSIWRHSTAFTDYRPAEHRAGCSPLHRQVLLLMSQGTTDDVAARKMDVSVRTYRRHVADVLAALGSTSRFQAGVVAVERGWL